MVVRLSLIGSSIIYDRIALLLGTRRRLLSPLTPVNISADFFGNRHILNELSFPTVRVLCFSFGYCGIEFIGIIAENIKDSVFNCFRLRIEHIVEGINISFCYCYFFHIIHLGHITNPLMYFCFLCLLFPHIIICFIV